MTRRSVMLRLTVTVLMLEAMMIAVLAVLIYEAASSGYQREFDTGLSARAEAIASLVDVSPQGRLVMEQPAHPINRRPASSSRPDLFRVWTDGGRIIAQSEQLQTASPDPWLDQVAPPPPRGQVIFNSRYNDRGYRCVWINCPVPDEPESARPGDEHVHFCHVALAISRRRLDDHGEDLVDLLLQVSSVMMIVSVLVTVLLVRWVMRPIRRAARDLARVEPGNAGAGSVGSDNPPDEVRPFIEALNSMVDRLAKAYNQQRHFTANASHELRTPMAVLKSTVQQALRRGLSPEEYAQALREVLEDLDRMEHLVEQLLLLSRLDEGAKESDTALTAPLSLRNLLSEIIERHHDDAKYRQVELNGPRVGDVQVAGRAEMLDVLFENLVSNAIRYNIPGGRVDLSGRAADGRVVVEIANTVDSPIPPDDLERIFDRFYRVERSRNRSSGGSGLGLAIAREIALCHGGDIHAENRPGGCVAFRVELPLAGHKEP